MIYLFQRIIQNHFQWTRPSPGRLGSAGEGEYVQEMGFGHEDWNFNTTMLVGGSVYGYCYYIPSEPKRNEQFSIAFAAYIGGQWQVVGFYNSCSYVENPPTDPEIIRQRARDLRMLGPSLGKPWAKLSEQKLQEKLIEESVSLRWRVSPANVVRLNQPVPIPKTTFDTRNFRIAKPTELDEKTYKKLYSLAENSDSIYDYGDESEFPEGREIESKHKRRERNPAVIAAAKSQFQQKHGHLYCQLCGFDFEKVYGEVGRGFIEAHHTVPLSELKGETKTKVTDIALVCANCHRMLHRNRPWLGMAEISSIVKCKGT